MKKILISGGIIAAVAAIIIGGTVAYFSDTETSEGNTLVAGTLDLVVDIDGNIQNPLEDPIFNSSDIKPGDSGEKTLSLHVDNDACGYVEVILTDDNENDCTEPEMDAESDCVPQGDGELNDNIIWTLWDDEGDQSGWQCGETPACGNDPKEGNNELDGEYENVLLSGNLNQDFSEPFGELPASNVLYYGISWSLPGTVGNEVQSDSLTARLVIKAEQKRNQYPTGCPGSLLTLENKDSQWVITGGDGINGVMRFNPAGSTFDFSFAGTAPEKGVNYSLIYYKNDWPGNGSLLLGSGMSDPSTGAVSFNGSVDLGTDLPAAGDPNSGAKIWLVLSNDFSVSEMTGWNPDKYLFETQLIQYDDTDN